MMSPSVVSSPPRRRPVAFGERVQLRLGVRPKDRPVSAVLHTARQIGPGREVWGLRLEAVSASAEQTAGDMLFVTVDIGDDGAVTLVGGDSRARAVELAHHIAAGVPVVGSVGEQLQALSAAVIALNVQAPAGEGAS
ncbi:hypothetical protein [uncultured Rhodospira sp.]|uniref:hypothetical protein n=1 Tax=uncultured Rhodospira sp. TaxID=1936189 RepID=UPI00262160A2|nr:hypothetical protein [uncultured Rhodospira sp.]